MADILSTLRSSFSPLRIPNFRIYLGGQAISLIGTWLQSTAQGWIVWELTQSEASLGIVNMFATLPILILGPWAGVWADRFDRRKLLIGTQIGAMLLAFILAFLVQTNSVQIWHVYGLSLLLGIVTALDLPAQQAFLGDLTGMSEVRKAVNLNIMFLQVSRVLGPAFAGFLIAQTQSAAPALWLNGLSFLAVILSLIAVRATQVRSSSASSANPLKQLMEGVRFLRTQPRMQDMFIFAAMMTFFAFSIVITILPAVAGSVFNAGADTLGLLMAASGLGALTGVVLVVPLAQAQRRSGLVLVGGTLWFGAWLLLFSMSNWLPLTLFSLFMGSIGAPTVMTMALGLVQVMSPPDMRGRLISLFTMISFGMQPVAALLIGYSAETLGVLTAIRINALFLITGAVLMLLFRSELRRWEVGIEKPQIVSSAAD